jgi:hypothetical protein
MSGLRTNQELTSKFWDNAHMRGTLLLALLSVKSSYLREIETVLENADDVPDTLQWWFGDGGCWRMRTNSFHLLKRRYRKVTHYQDFATFAVVATLCCSSVCRCGGYVPTPLFVKWVMELCVSRKCLGRCRLEYLDRVRLTGRTNRRPPCVT